MVVELEVQDPTLGYPSKKRKKELTPQSRLQQNNNNNKKTNTFSPINRKLFLFSYLKIKYIIRDLKCFKQYEYINF